MSSESCTVWPSISTPLPGGAASAMTVAAAGLVTGLLGLVLGLVAYCRVNKLVSNRSPGQAARDRELQRGRRVPRLELAGIVQQER